MVYQFEWPYYLILYVATFKHNLDTAAMYVATNDQASLYRQFLNLIT